MKCVRTLIVLTAALIFSSCQHETDPVRPGDEFYLRISVATPDGAAVPGIRISAWNRLSFGALSTMKRSSSLRVNPGSTSFGFDLKSVCRATFTIFDLNDKLVRTLFDATANAGRYALIWDARDAQAAPVRTGVYKCRFAVRDTSSGAPVFQDSIYAVLWQPDPAVSVLGWTSATGRFETKETLWFPNLYDLPLLIATLETDPTPVGSFTLLDTISIVLTDTTTNRQQYFQSVVKDGANDFELVWNPPAARALAPARAQHFYSGNSPATPASPDSVVLLSIVGIVLPPDWRLHQNYPNPFN